MVGGSKRNAGAPPLDWFGGGGCVPGPGFAGFGVGGFGFASCIEGDPVAGADCCGGAWPVADPLPNAGVVGLTWRSIIVFAVPMSMGRWLASLISEPRMTWGVMAKTVSSEEWSVVVWPKRYFRIGICARPGMPLRERVWESSMMPPIRLDSPSRRRISPRSTFFWPMMG